AVIALVEEPAPPPVDLTSEVADELLEAMATVKILNPLVPIEGPDWFELSGRRIRISVDRFGQFGNSGTPPGMIGASHSSFLYGQIGGEPNVPCQPLPRLTAVYPAASDIRSEEHTSELQSRENLVCRLLLEKKKNWKDARSGSEGCRAIQPVHGCNVFGGLGRRT